MCREDDVREVRGLAELILPSQRDAEEGMGGFVLAGSALIGLASKASPDKELIEGPPEGNCACNKCPFMRLNTMEKVYPALRDLTPRIEVDPTLRERARIPIDRMLALS